MLNPLYFKQLHVCVIPDWRIHIPVSTKKNNIRLQSEKKKFCSSNIIKEDSDVVAMDGKSKSTLPEVNDAPHVCSEPHSCTGVSLILAN